jgi:glycine oxidase
MTASLSMTMTSDVVIVGGGAIGLSVAYRLAREGVAATLIDRRGLGREASWAGAGLIPAYTERLRGHPALELRSWSAALYPVWADWLREETGLDVGFRRTGGVDVGWTEIEANDLRSMAGRWKAEGVVYERLEPGDFARVEPALNPDLAVAYYLPDRAQVRNPWLLRALALAATRRGATLRPGQAALGFEARGDRVYSVQTTEGPIACGAVVVAAGAWSGSLLDGLGVHAPTPPFKGEIVLLRGDRPLLRRIVEHGRHYLVPRDDGRVLVGATEEEVGFDTRSTPAGVRELLDEALRICPPLGAAEVERTWAGLRPGSLDTRPYLGALPGFANVFAATGHKRAGLQLAPATAEVVADLVLGRPPRLDLSPFRPGREPAPGDEGSFRS